MTVKNYNNISHHGAMKTAGGFSLDHDPIYIYRN